jgi:transcription-repair coupling factor (superfamily II helicase)
MSLYKRVSQVRDAAEVAALQTEVRDRYGPLPPAVEDLLAYGALRLRSAELKLGQVDVAGTHLLLKPAPAAPPDPAALVALVRGIPGAGLSPDGVVRVPLAGAEPLAALEAVLDRLAGLPVESRAGL